MVYIQIITLLSIIEQWISKSKSVYLIWKHSLCNVFFYRDRSFAPEIILPSEIKVGQVVNIQATPMVVPFANQTKFKIILKLYSILIVDDTTYCIR